MKEYAFSNKGFGAMLRNFEKMEKKLPIVREKFIVRSLDYLEEQARKYIQETTGGSSWYVLTHTLENSFKKDAIIGKIVNDCWYSAFVEYGTGTKGEGTHENPQNYQYDLNEHGDSGWWFKDDNGNLHWTKGMKAHRYMYQAVMDYLSPSGHKRIFKQVFDEEIGVIFK